MALVLTRKEGGKVIIFVPPSNEPTLIEVDVARLKKDPESETLSCRLAFEAPMEVEIDRLEVWIKKREKRAWTKNSGSLDTT